MEYESYQMSNGQNYRSHSRTGVTSGTSSMDDHLVQEHLNSINAQYSSTRAQRIRAAIFPETLEDGTTDGVSPIPIPSTQFINGHPTAVQKLSEPSQLLKNAVIDIINYKEDAEITEKALPELIRLLNDDDPIVAGRSSTCSSYISSKRSESISFSNTTNDSSFSSGNIKSTCE